MASCLSICKDAPETDRYVVVHTVSNNKYIGRYVNDEWIVNCDGDEVVCWWDEIREIGRAARRCSFSYSGAFTGSPLDLFVDNILFQIHATDTSEMVRLVNYLNDILKPWEGNQ